MAAIRQLALCLMMLIGLAGAAQAQGIPLLRDAEAEYGLDVLARPILTAAGLPARRIARLYPIEVLYGRH